MLESKHEPEGLELLEDPGGLVGHVGRWWKRTWSEIKRACWPMVRVEHVDPALLHLPLDGETMPRVADRIYMAGKAAAADAQEQEGEPGAALDPALLPPYLALAGSYLLTAGYAFGVIYLYSYYSELLPGNRFGYSYPEVIASLVQHPWILILALMPVLFIVPRYITKDLRQRRTVRAQATWYAAQASALRREFRRRRKRRGLPSAEELRLFQLEKQVLNSAPDGYWFTATEMLTWPLRPLYTLSLFWLILVGASFGLIWLARPAAIGLTSAALLHSFNIWSYRLVASLFALLLLAWSLLLAMCVHTSLCVLDGFYYSRDGQRQRRILLSSCAALVLFAVLVASTGSYVGRLQESFYSVVFRRVTVVLSEGADTPPIYAPQLGLPASDTSTHTVSGFLVRPITSDDVCMIVTLPPQEGTDAGGHKWQKPLHGIVFIDKSDVIAIKRGFSDANGWGLPSIWWP
jgi:hypothetical protein